MTNRECFRQFKEIYDDFYLQEQHQQVTKRETSTQVDVHVSRIGQDLMEVNSLFSEIIPENSIMSKSKEYDHFKKPFKHVKDVKKSQTSSHILL